METAITEQTAKTPAPWVETTFTLKTPIEFEGQTIQKLVFAEPDMDTLERVEETMSAAANQELTMGQTRAILEAFAGLPSGALRKVKQTDFVAMAEVIAPLIEAAFSTGTGELQQK
jgi:hypothetical protein